MARNAKPAVNSEAAFKCWAIENPENRTLQKSVVFTMEPWQCKQFVLVLQAPMTVSRSDLLAKLILSHVSEDSKPLVEKRVLAAIGN